MLKLVEEAAGLGNLEYDGTVVPQVRYAVSRYQGMTQAGLPIPGLHKVEGTIDMTAVSDASSLVGTDVVLRLADGRALRITLADATDACWPKATAPVAVSAADWGG